MNPPNGKEFCKQLEHMAGYFVELKAAITSVEKKARPYEFQFLSTEIDL